MILDRQAARVGCGGWSQKACHSPSPLASSARSAATSFDGHSSQRIPAPFRRPPSSLQPASVGPLPTSQPRAR